MTKASTFDIWLSTFAFRSVRSSLDRHAILKRARSSSSLCRKAAAIRFRRDCQSSSIAICTGTSTNSSTWPVERGATRRVPGEKHAPRRTTAHMVRSSSSLCRNDSSMHVRSPCHAANVAAMCRRPSAGSGAVVDWTLPRAFNSVDSDAIPKTWRDPILWR